MLSVQCKDSLAGIAGEDISPWRGQPGEAAGVHRAHRAFAAVLAASQASQQRAPDASVLLQAVPCPPTERDILGRGGGCSPVLPGWPGQFSRHLS